MAINATSLYDKLVGINVDKNLYAKIQKVFGSSFEISFVGNSHYWSKEYGLSYKQGTHLEEVRAGVYAATGTDEAGVLCNRVIVLNEQHLKDIERFAKRIKTLNNSLPHNKFINKLLAIKNPAKNLNILETEEDFDSFKLAKEDIPMDVLFTDSVKIIAFRDSIIKIFNDPGADFSFLTDDGRGTYNPAARDNINICEVNKVTTCHMFGDMRIATFLYYTTG